MSDATVQGPLDGTGKHIYVLKVTGVNIGGTPTDVYVPLTAQAGLWTYQAVASNSTCAANKNHLVLFNGTGSGKKVRIQEIFAYPHLAAGAIAGANATLQAIGVGQEGTGGTAGSIRKHDTTDPDLPNQIVSRLGATSLTIPQDREVGGCALSIEEGSAAHTMGRYTIYQKVGNQSELILNENQGVVIRQTGLAGIGAVSIHIVFTTN
jgi:hypothetical protein